jgi:hypothetical protein
MKGVTRIGKALYYKQVAPLGLNDQRTCTTNFHCERGIAPYNPSDFGKRDYINSALEDV